MKSLRSGIQRRCGDWWRERRRSINRDVTLQECSKGELRGSLSELTDGHLCLCGWDQSELEDGQH